MLTYKLNFYLIYKRSEKSAK